MTACPVCHSHMIIQKSSALTRMLLFAYIFLSIFFFVGIYFTMLIALIPLIIPYINQCLQCNKTFFRLAPHWNKASLFEVKNRTTKFLVGFLPSMSVITLLILFFPYTGLGRIVYLPIVYFLNSMMIIIGLVLSRFLNRTASLISWTVIILLTLILVIAFYPQDGGPDGIKLILGLP